MTDELTERIAHYAAGATYASLPDDVQRAARVRVVDTLACAIAAHESSPAAIAEAAATTTSPVAGRIIGHRVADMAFADAAYANSVMIRYLDLNDTHMPGFHPSDVIGALVASAEAHEATGERLLTSVVVAYETALRFSSHTDLRARGWDQGYALGFGAVAGLGALRRLPATEIAHALSMMAAAGPPLRVARTGSLSMWKGAATAHACRNATVIVELAARGMTGPGAAFSGRDGVFDRVVDAVELPPFSPAGPSLILETALKPSPVCYHLQGAVAAARQLHAAVEIDAIERIEVGMYADAWRETASEPDKWDPTTRETADHSLPYVFAHVLRSGSISQESFSDEEFGDPSLRPLMARIHAHVDDELEGVFPTESGTRVHVVDTRGNEHVADILNPPGHARRPLSDDQVHEKFLRLTEPYLAGRSESAWDAWWNVAALPDLSPALDLIALG